MAREIGLLVKAPVKECDDPACPFHGRLPVRKKIMEGVVVSAKMQKTVVIQKNYSHYISKLRRLERRRKNIPAHNPPCIATKVGDTVRIAECRPISKTVSFVVVEKVKEAK
jgi:small subunit ribosomal protein S17